jgi:hypothetical protein
VPAIVAAIRLKSPVDGLKLSLVELVLAAVIEPLVALVIVK